MTRPKSISTHSTAVEVFLEQASKVPVPSGTKTPGRLVFAMDATASREPCWDLACQIQTDMFLTTAALGQLLVQLCYYQGYGEFYAKNWTCDAIHLREEIAAVRCKAGQTQIQRVLEHTLLQAKEHKIRALVFIGDCMEELAEQLLNAAGQLALRGIPAFIFHEGYDPIAEQTFRRIAGISKGAYCRFDQSSTWQLRELLNAVAVYAVGGIQALQTHAKTHARLSNVIIKQLTDQS